MLESSKYGRFTLKTSIQIGLQIMDRLESLHKLGFTHQDLKPENILLGTRDKSDLRSSEIILVDFGLTRKYLVKEGSHIPFEHNVKFNGNLMF
jgi:serine/threonine protein kinase